ncbi:hypothetical protein V8J36_05275 [Frigidibacter sp. MR17.14]|uniref:DUF6950 family protein n=1 Tax=Frigidibacter sp. MR17.14 TaxID=3126509 RepID=UPI00301309CE
MNLDALQAYLREVRQRPFCAGEHDCLIFANEAWRRMHGVGWADDWLGRYLGRAGLIRAAHELRAEYGFDSAEAAVDARLTRVAGLPPRGALVLSPGAVEARWILGASFGICLGTHAAHPGHHGLAFLPITDITAAWVAE